MNNEILLRYYIDIFLSIKCANYHGKTVLAKPVLLLSLFDCISDNIVLNNKIIHTTLKKTYSNYFSNFHYKETPIQYPFYFMASESFWHLKWRGNPIQTKAPTDKMLRDSVDYAYLDNALWDLLQDAENRERLRKAIVRHFFNETTEDTETLMAAESSNTYGQEEATDRQLWALKRATGIDYRGRGLTKAEAWEMINEAKKKAEEQGIDPSKEEATPRQLNYLKRHTGIDYSDRGLTKAEATRMIRNQKETEAYAVTETDQVEATPRQLRYLKRATGIDYSDRGLTKREASKMIQELIDGTEEKKVAEPAFKPGSLEDILSKCKTREEQLAAARKYFGENK